jgi:hypothetical protein
MADIDHMQAGGVEHLISAGAPRRTAATSTIQHVGVSEHQSTWPLLILEAPAPAPRTGHAPAPADLNHAQIQRSVKAAVPDLRSGARGLRKSLIAGGVSSLDLSGRRDD